MIDVIRHNLRYNPPHPSQTLHLILTLSLHLCRTSPPALHLMRRVFWRRDC